MMIEEYRIERGNLWVAHLSTTTSNPDLARSVTSTSIRVDQKVSLRASYCESFREKYNLVGMAGGGHIRGL